MPRVEPGLWEDGRCEQRGRGVSGEGGDVDVGKGTKAGQTSVKGRKGDVYM